MDYLVLAIMFLVVGAVLIWHFKYGVPLERAKRRAERKVKMSDPIQRRDIDVLQRTDSGYLKDAIALRRAQIERGEDPDVLFWPENEDEPREPRIGFR